MAGLWWQRIAQAQPSVADLAWEYATVEELEQYNVGNVQVNSANVCYHTSNGCRWDTIRVNTTRWSQTNDAVAAATARLGLQGWEVVSTTPPVHPDRFSVLLKRIRRTDASDEQIE